MRLEVIVPFRAGDEWRGRGWLRVLAHLGEVFPGVPVTIADDDGQPFSRGGSITMAARASDADVLLVCDADLLVPPDQLREVVSLAAAGPGLVVPFSRYLYLTASQTTRLTRDLRAPIPPRPRASWSMEGSVGGAGAFDRATLDVTGGYPPIFRGWGFEDVAFELLADELAGPTRRVHGEAFHLYHPVDVTNDPASAGYARNVAALMQLIAARARGRDALLDELGALAA